MEPIICGVCGKNGGKFVFRGKLGYIHDNCLGGVRMRDTAKSIYPFVTTNIHSEHPIPIEVQSTRHLRRLEAEHGCQSFAMNYDRPESNERFER